jgi:hypothetical protein
MVAVKSFILAFFAPTAVVVEVVEFLVVIVVVVVVVVVIVVVVVVVVVVVALVVVVVVALVVVVVVALVVVVVVAFGKVAVINGCMDFGTPTVLTVAWVVSDVFCVTAVLTAAFALLDDVEDDVGFDFFGPVKSIISDDEEVDEDEEEEDKEDAEEEHKVLTKGLTEEGN